MLPQAVYQSFTAPVADTLASEAERMLETFAQMRGLKIQRAKGKSAPGLFSISISLVRADSATPPSDTQEARDWDRGCARFGLPTGAVGKFFTSRGTVYKVAGLMPSRPKFPVLAERADDGKRFKMTAITVKFSKLRDEA